MLKDYIQLCWFKGEPHDLPVDRKFLWINISLYLLFGLFIQANISDPIEAFLQVFLEILITLIFMSVIVLKKDEGFYNFERFLTAILVCENFIYVLGLPLAFWFIFAKGSAVETYPIYIAGFLVFWSLAIIAYLLKELFEFSWQISTSLSILYFLLTYLGSLGLLLAIGI
ncbi:hypothetical protein [methanotrophic endosymbiont of Bathymodiolus puteoserpentis (Logatchev)]|jgi:hypothetical protein|uniref:hypothetical protein n=1 Tax=methanotrophic endosymbiont of Bathymodiolus puteoserpentis (Logatchev) TaxID=343235 RepID=UPI0013CBA768|nr:hypothetical protein [methanotrophic endosymbiont of Bathymodiolus puteoserpentis (Logatchev)]SHE23729.1 hypothetical protein BPUTEOMOX_1773 [methanotrophic endosymbiont of Bathymodiolus puteoserpentis (Logatchev)]